MKTKEVEIRDVLQFPERYSGQALRFEGTFIATVNRMGIYEGQLKPNETWEIARNIEIDAPNLIESAFQVISPYVGGPFFYFDQAIVEGRLLDYPHPHLGKIVRLIINRAGIKYEVIPGPDD